MCRRTRSAPSSRGAYLPPDLRPVFTARARGVVPAPAEDNEAAWRSDQSSFYAKAGISCTSHDIIQTGVMVLSQQHRRLMRDIYDAPYPADLDGLEQFPLSARIIDDGLLYPLNSRFNRVFPELAVVHYPYLYRDGGPQGHLLAKLAVMTELENAYFLHFAGAHGFIQYTR